MDTLSLTKEARIYNGEKTICLANGAGRTGQPSEVDSDQLKRPLKLILLKLQESGSRTQHRPFYGHLAFEANWKGEKA